VILQSNYIPWLGYFSLISSADVLVVLDSAKYTKNDWRNRNQLRGANGLFWLTIPIDRKSTNSSIYNARVTDTGWASKHLAAIRGSLAKLDYAEHLFRFLEPIYATFADERSLHQINVKLIRDICQLMSIGTKIVLDTEVASPEFLARGVNPTHRLVEICKELGARTYLTGPLALQYLELKRFRESSIEVAVADYSLLPTYPQKYREFFANVSVLDFLAAVGAFDAGRLLQSTNIALN